MSLLLLFQGSGSSGVSVSGATITVSPVILDGSVTATSGAVPTTLAKGGHGGGLWEIYQEEMARKFRPKPKKPDPEPEPQPEPFEPATPSGFFDVPVNPEEMMLRVRASAEAKARQHMLNNKTISDLLRKARR